MVRRHPPNYFITYFLKENNGVENNGGVTILNINYMTYRVIIFMRGKINHTID